MNKVKERELFFKYLSDMYLQNPKLPFTHDIVYNELARFCINNDSEYIIDMESLVGIQVKLSNKYRSNKSVNISSDDYYWKIFNKAGKTDNEFATTMYNSLKLYISAEAKDLYKIAVLLFNYMIKENIVMHSKIASIMRSDVLMCRIGSVDEAKKVINYLKTFKYTSKVKINPFMYNIENIGITMDGRLSYNSVLSKLICQYLKKQKNSNSLEKISNDGFATFINDEINNLKGENKTTYINLYEIDSNDKYKDFIMVSSIIYKNLNNTMNLSLLASYKNFKDAFLDDLEFISFDAEEVKMKYVIYSMAAYYSVDEVHKRIMKFIETGDYTLFTREGEKNIRAIMYNNFTAKDTLEIISRIGYKALITASKTTYDKNGKEQLKTAIEELFNNKSLLSFTNDDYTRSRLGLVIPKELLKKVIISKLEEKNMNVDSTSLMQLIMEEINVLESNNIKSKIIK